MRVKMKKNSIKTVKKHCFTLLETLISIGLMSLILSSLSYFFYQINILNIASEKLENNAFKMRYVENRLMKVLPRTISEKDKQKDFYFFTNRNGSEFSKPGNPYLVFTFDNSINLVDSLFSNHVIGRIFLDPQNNLSLAIVPSIKKWETNTPVPLSREILATGVESLNFSFFIAPKNEKINNESDENLPPNSLSLPFGTWVSDWRQEYNQLPVIVQIEITYKENNELKKRKFSVPIVNAKKPILYNL